MLLAQRVIVWGQKSAIEGFPKMSDPRIVKAVINARFNKLPFMYRHRNSPQRNAAAMVVDNRRLRN